MCLCDVVICGRLIVFLYFYSLVVWLMFGLTVRFDLVPGFPVWCVLDDFVWWL